jgi:type III pantothenate kinase
MKPALVADVGNTRIKWGHFPDPASHPVPGSPFAGLPPDDPAAWERQLEAWGLKGPQSWAICGVHPARRDRLAEWARGRGDAVWVLDDWRHLPLAVRLEHPERVGIDRLLDAVAAKDRLQSQPEDQGTPAVIVDAGSAVTVDWLDETGAFCGGAIFPGLRLMARALHEHTALLPLVEVKNPVPPLPGTSTPAAMAAGIFWAAAGGIQAAVDQLAGRSPEAPTLFLTGGDAALLQPALGPGYHFWPGMTLEGLRLTAEVHP